MDNPYLPNTAIITDIKEEVQGERAITTFRTEFKDKKLAESFEFIPGQCAMVTLLGMGECFFAISSSPTKKGYLEFSVMRLGKVTQSLHELEVENSLGVRGPYGNGFPVDEWKGKNILCIGGGIGQAPLRSLIQYVMDNRKDYGKLDVIYGARSTADLCYMDEFAGMEKRDDVDVHLSIDNEEEGWTRFVGFVPDNLKRLAPSPENTIAITCGPPIMIKFVIQALEKLGFTPDQIFTTLEMRMTCGIGKCGRCNIGNLYVCKDGPVFSWEILKDVKGEM
ncbi:MAG: FAD/NAD(P)-binding protein [Methanopyri archaeon]|jgi:NAD(P)H-flavin reductase|nr:FAD/NAD(P)-binding protein [Methanopyri archaeon]